MNKRRKKTGVLRFILTSGMFIAVIVLVALVIRNGGLDVRKLWNRMTGEKADEFFYENTAGGSFAAVGDGFAALSGSYLSVFDETGDKTVSKLLSFSKPELSSAGKYGAAWSLGGRDIVLFTENRIEKTLQTENNIISVTINSRGYFCVSSEEPGYTGSVTVYNRNGKALYKWSSGSNYVLSARLRDSSELMILTVGKSGSELIRCRISSEQVETRYTYDGVIIDADFTSNGVTAVTAEELIFLDRSFSEKSRYSFEGKSLDAYSVDTQFTAVVLGDYQVGGTRRLVTLSNGEVIAEANVAGDIAGMDMAGNHVALLYVGELDEYTYRLVPEASWTPPAGAEHVTVREDGSVIAAGAYSAKIFTLENGGAK